MKIHFMFVAAILASVGLHAATPQSGSFTYQGQLAQNGTPTTGTHDLAFALFSAPVGGTQIGPTITEPAYPVANGVFTIDLNFGIGTFTGNQLYLDVKVDGNELSPRQPINSVPVAQYALSGPNSPASTGSSGTSTTFQNDHLYAGISVVGESSTAMVLLTAPALNPAGESTVPGYAGAIDVVGLTSGVANTTPLTVGSGFGTGKAVPTDVRVLARMDKAILGLAKDVFGGTYIANVQIDVLENAGGTYTVKQSYCYATVLISALQPMPQTKTFEMTLTPGKIGYRIPQSGAPGGYIQGGFDFIGYGPLLTAPCVLP